MITVNKYTLSNGLRVVHWENPSTEMVALNLLYNVGARDEHPEHTGFAHLFEHLMFGGSINIPDYDTHVQQAGGENNAWTNNDITNYYITLPRQNVETGFWLESDRMLSLDFSERSLDVQRHVVIEEFKQRHLNQPYGDVGTPLPMAHHRQGYGTHRRCNTGGGEGFLLPILCAQQCHIGRNGEHQFQGNGHVYRKVVRAHS